MRRPAVSAEAGSSTEERILRAAYACFERFGVAKTTIEDIAQGAGVSRPTVYKYFGGKEAILDEISQRETHKVNAEVRAHLVRLPNFADFLTETLLLVVRFASRNPYIRRMTESHEFQIQSMQRSSTMYQLQQEWWSGLLRHAAETKELAPDLEMDEVISWLSHTQSLLLIYIENPEIDDPALRRMIRRFVVEPLLAQPGSMRA